uniref:NADH-ubiquinone oxidoreductase chain 2 n=1 Tax=Fabaeformiscandona kushiroensis TaxID=1564202 RepID=A0A0S3PNB0_9CRUS|nr:NADH dehydrogenase subuinit 2 [Fabaeformiscandona kushiroensis]
MILPWKMVFFNLLIMGSIFSISASSWFMAWVGLEMNMLAILALLMNFSSPREKEATLKYFLIQALASSVLLSTALFAASLQQGLSNLSVNSFLIFFSLLMKMGAAPFHLWLPQVVEGLSWSNSFIILSWQKIAPSALLLNCFEVKHNLMSSLLLVAAFSAVFGALGGLSQTSLRKILSFSSINHLGWALASLSLGLKYWAIYFLLYCLLLFLVVVLTKMFNISSLTSSSLFPSKWAKVAFYSSLFSFGGLPPFMGFLPKWILISKLIFLSPALTALLVMSSLPPLFFYLNLALLAMFNKTKNFFVQNMRTKIPTIVVTLNILLAPTISLVLMW